MQCQDRAGLFDRKPRGVSSWKCDASLKKKKLNIKNTQGAEAEKLKLQIVEEPGKTMLAQH